MINLTAFQIATLSAVLLYSIFDPLRDANVKRLCSWWKWHLFKWLSTYPVLGVLVYTNFGDCWQESARWTMGVAIVSWFIWRLSIRHLGGQKWESWIVKLIRMIFGIRRVW